MGGIIFLVVMLIIILIIAFNTIKIVKQSEVYIIERLGKFHKIADAGLTIIIPFFVAIRCYMVKVWNVCCAWSFDFNCFICMVQIYKQR